MKPRLQVSMKTQRMSQSVLLEPLPSSHCLRILPCSQNSSLYSLSQSQLPCFQLQELYSKPSNTYNHSTNDCRLSAIYPSPTGDGTFIVRLALEGLDEGTVSVSGLPNIKAATAAYDALQLWAKMTMGMMIVYNNVSILVYSTIMTLCNDNYLISRSPSSCISFANFQPGAPQALGASASTHQA